MVGRKIKQDGEAYAHAKIKKEHKHEKKYNNCNRN